MIKTIILTRHGETEKNKDDPERKLTSSGKRQMKVAAGLIKPLVQGKEMVIVSTQTDRARSSSNIVSKEIGCKIIYSNNLRVENIKLLQNPKDKNKNLTQLYFQNFDAGKLPASIPPPTEIVKRFQEIISNNQQLNILIFVGHSGALESFINYQTIFKSNIKLERELNYGEVVVLKRSK